MPNETKPRRRSQHACRLRVTFSVLGSSEPEELHCDLITVKRVDDYTIIELRARDGGVYNTRNANFLLTVGVNPYWKQA